MSSSTKTSPHTIITSTPYSDLTNTLTKSPTTSSPTTRSKSHSTSSGSGPSSSDAYAQRAMNNTSTWQPKLDRRQSFSQEEYKHVMQIRSGSTGGAARLVGGLGGEKGNEGFSEEGHGY